MTKYDFELDLNTKNSLSLIIEKIENGTQILEFGPAHGRMTKYLSETKKCKVDIVEIDEESGREAAKYASKALIGEREGDIGNFLWLEILKNERYDYIIFADVLEHLYDPWKVLSDCRRLLKDDGSILISIPNVSHNSVLINLLTDKFNYNPIGLLDNTHIRFFTYHSLKDMIAKAGLVTVSEQATYGRVGQIEIPGNYDKINNFHVEKYLKNRERGNVYQFVFESKKKEYYEEQDVLISKNIDGRLSDEITLYIQEKDDTYYTENKSIRKKIYGNEIKATFDLKAFGEVRAVRLDPSDKKGIIRIKNVELIRDEQNSEKIDLLIKESNADVNVGDYYIFLHDDPQIFIELSDKIFKILKVSYEILSADQYVIDTIYNLINHCRWLDEIEKKDLFEKIKIENEYLNQEKMKVNDLNKKIQLSDTEKKGQQNEIERLQLEKEEQQKEIERLQLEQDIKKDNYLKVQTRKIMEQEGVIKQKDQVIKMKEEELNNIYNSRGWKLLNKVKKLLNK